MADSKKDSRVTTHVPDRILTVKEVLSPKECQLLIQSAEEAGFKPSPLSGGGHGQTGREGARTSQFRVKDDFPFATSLWKKIQDFVPDHLRGIKPVAYMNSQTRGDEYTAVGVNEHLRFYKYDPGQHILKHDDYRMTRYRYDAEADQYYYQCTFFTALFYLNDEFEEGETCFWTKYATTGTTGHCRFIRDIEFTPADLRVKPEMGMLLLNDHMVQHEGEAPRKGTKYILRTDILHERPISKDRVLTKMKKNQEYSEWSRHYEPSCRNYTE